MTTVRVLEEHLARPAVVLRCQCGQCGLPYARLQNGCIIIESRHHGETHQNVMPIATLAEMAKAQGRQREG